MSRDDHLLLWILGGALFVLFTIVLDYLAFEFKVLHRSWPPGVAVGLAATVVLLARFWLQRTRRDEERD